LRLREDDDLPPIEIKKKRRKKPTLTCSENFEMSIENKSNQIEVDEQGISIIELDQKYNLEKNLLESEAELYYIRKRDYIRNHPTIEPIMRSILLDWLMEVSYQFRFKRNTYHCSVMLIDLYMSIVQNIPPTMLQLVGVVCLCIAAKNEVSIILFLLIILLIEYIYIRKF
jgi:hypothetical protein